MIFKAKLKSKELISKNTWEITLTHDEVDFYFNAGQYVWIITPVGRYAYSIASSSSNTLNLKFIFRDNPENKFKQYLLGLEIGKEVEINGPYGILRAPKVENSAIYLAGGVGIAPFVSIIKSLNDVNQERNISVLFANSTDEDEFYVKELNEIAKNRKSFNFIKVVGKITEDHLKKVILSHDKPKLHVIGSQRFVNGMAELLRKVGINDSDIFYEENFPDVDMIKLNIEDTSIFKKIVDQSANHVIMTDQNGKVVYANKSAEIMTGYKFEEMKGQTPRLWGGQMDSELYSRFWKTIKIDKKPFRGEFLNMRKSGEIYDVFATVSPILDNDNNILGFMGIEEDVTENIKNRNELKRISDLMITQILDRNKHG